MRKTETKPAAATTAFPMGTAIEAAAGIPAAISIATNAMITPKAPKTLPLTPEAKLLHPSPTITEKDHYLYKDTE